MVGERVDDPRGNCDQFGVTAGPSEPERLDPLAPMRVASAARAAAVAADQSLADDSVPGADRVDVGPDIDHGPGPLVSGDHREMNPPRVRENPGHNLDVGPAEPCLAA